MTGMTQRWLVAAVLLAACGTDPDPREPTFEVVAIEVLRPGCGQVQCHSKTTLLNEYAFDTLESTKTALAGKLGVSNDPVLNQSCVLIKVLDGDGRPQMPFDSPMAEPDRALIDRWLAAGAPGL